MEESPEYRNEGPQDTSRQNGGSGASQDSMSAGAGHDGSRPQGEDSGTASQKPSRSKRRRQRRNEAKRLAKGGTANNQGVLPFEATEGNQASGSSHEPADGQARKADEGQPAGQAGEQRQNRQNRQGQGKQGSRRQGQGGEQKQGNRRQGQDQRQGQGRKSQGEAKRFPPRAEGGQRQGEGRRHDRQQDQRGSANRRGGHQRGDERRAQPFPGDSVIPPPEVIAALEGGNFDVPQRSRRANPHAPQAPAVRVLETLVPSSESLAVLDLLEAAIDEASPLQAKHRAALKGDIRSLWEDLTSEKEFRSADYLGTPPALSAYLRYFLPWNVYRAASIFSNSDFCLPDKAVVVDLGSGPLTLPIALYAARPELRDVPLTFYCVDRVERVMETGLAIFETLCMRTEGRLPPWRIELRKDGVGAPLPERAHLLAAANVFNEFFWKDKRPLGERALETARTLLSYLRENGSLFVMEPGDPRSGAFISALRAALIAEGASPLGPCPHALSCPMPGIFRYLLPPEETRTVKGDPNAAPSRFVLQPVVMPKKRDKFPWCHFGVDTDKAPAWLQALSEEAGLPKERAVFSYLWAARGAMARPFAGIPDPVHGGSEKERRAKAGKGILVRVVSEPFGLPEGWTGQYACSSLGYTLLRRSHSDTPFEPGDLLEVTTSPLARNDEKSGAIVLPT